jgi:hypothetical protein
MLVFDKALIVITFKNPFKKRACKNDFGVP